jgi:hypothetical protein
VHGGGLADAVGAGARDQHAQRQSRGEDAVGWVRHAEIDAVRGQGGQWVHEEERR